MPRFYRWLLRAFVALLVLVVVAAAVGLSYRAWRQRVDGRALAISTPQGIDEALFLTVGETRQWVSIRGHDRSRPVLLFLHGGPGAPMHGLALPLLPWERDFVVVQWDQPGAGRTLAETGSFDRTLTIESIARDGNRIAERIRDRLQAPRLILVGWSWGSALGLHMIKARPDLYAAFIGTGQVVSIPEGEALAYAQVLTKARQRGDADAIAELEAIGPPPYETLAELETQRRWATRYEGYQSIVEMAAGELLEPRGSLRDVWYYVAGLQESTWHFFGRRLDGPFAGADMRALGPAYDVPVYVVQGTGDDYTPAEPARRFIAGITAPDKAFIAIEGAGHFAVVSHAEEFLAILNDLYARGFNHENR